MPSYTAPVKDMMFLYDKLRDNKYYNELEKYLAARTFEESGNYSLDNFEVKVSDSLDTGLSNGGIFK